MTDDATTMMTYMQTTVNASGAEQTTIDSINTLITTAVTDFNTAVGTVIVDIEAAMSSFTDVTTDLDTTATNIKTYVGTAFDTVVTDVASTALTSKDFNKLITPVLNDATKQLQTGLKEVQKAAFDELKNAKKELQKTIRKDIKSMKKDMIKEVNSIASDVEDLILADGTLDTTTSENLLLELEGVLD